MELNKLEEISLTSHAIVAVLIHHNVKSYVVMAINNLDPERPPHTGKLGTLVNIDS